MRATRSVREILISVAALALAGFVFALSFGVLAIAAGIPGWAAVLMSALVFAGSAQFAALGVITAGGSVLTAVLAGGLLNLRYIATGIAVARSLPGGRLVRALLGQLVVDESYAMAAGAGETGRPHRRNLLVTRASLYTVWVLGNLIGTLLGPVLGNPTRLGLDAAFQSLFTALPLPLLSC